VHLLMGYIYNHPKTWDGNMIYFHYSYNKVVHNFTGKSHFETFFGYFTPSPLDVVYGQQGGVMEYIIEEAL
jgi:hypothetical protein